MSNTLVVQLFIFGHTDHVIVVDLVKNLRIFPNLSATTVRSKPKNDAMRPTRRTTGSTFVYLFIAGKVIGGKTMSLANVTAFFTAVALSAAAASPQQPLGQGCLILPFFHGTRKC